MSLAQEKDYSYADILEMDDGNRYELYDGEPVALASPATQHQRISMALSGQLYSYLAGKKCEVFHAPFDVRLFEEKDDSPKRVNTVVQPDIVVICDENKLDIHGCKGAPDLVIEILSPSTLRQDRLVKYNLYQKAGVKEYWIVDPEEQIVSVYLLEDGQYHAAAAYGSNSVIPVSVLDDCKIDLKQVFP